MRGSTDRPGRPESHGPRRRTDELERKLSRRGFLRLAGGSLLASTAVIGSVGGYGFLVEPRLLEVSNVPVRLSGLPEAFHGVTVAVLADLHIGSWTVVEWLHSMVDRTLGASPDLIVLLGDYITSRAPVEREILESVASRLSAPLGAYAVLGNHDHRKGVGSVVEALRRGGIRVLRNESVALHRDGGTIHLAGLDDVREKKDDLPATLRGIPPESSILLLAHEPDFADTVAADGRVALQLSGHSHGGQIRIPGLPRILPALGRKYPEGLRQVGPTQLYTSRGLGEIFPPIRINCPPELPVISLLRDAR